MTEETEGGEMPSIEEREKTFQAFMKFSTIFVAHVVVILIFLALVGT